MGELQIDVLTSGDHAAARLTTPKGKHVDLWVKANVPLDHTGTGWVAAVTPPAMKLHATIRTDAPVDPQLIDNLGEVQKVLNSWYPDLRLVDVQAPNRQTAAPGRGVGAFFSGGVDSFYSAIDPDVTHLVFVHGFDIDVDNDELAAKALEGCRRAAAALGKTLIEVRTNIRRFSDKHTHWAYRYHGAALAMVGHLLADHLDTLYIPSSYDSGTLMPWGTHPDLDHWWSGSRVRFVHHGFESTRAQKVAALVDNEAAMDNLRVCWLNWRDPDGDYNCGHCEKCMRTVISIQVAGGAGRCKTLPAMIPPNEVAKLKINNHGSMAFMEQNLDALRASGRGDPELEAALAALVDRGVRPGLLARLRH
jgi:hypothetical protein